VTGPSGPIDIPQPGWEPDNQVELDLLRAMAAGDHREYFRVIGAADLFLPQPVRGDSPPSADEQEFLTANLFGHTFLPVFTSVRGLAAQVGDAVDGYTVTSYPELRDKWPDPQWRLAINPGTPIDAYVAVDAVAGAAIGEVVVPSAGEVLVEAAAEEVAREAAAGAAGEGPAGNEAAGTSGLLGPLPAADTDESLTAAARRGDGDGYLRALRDALVIVPTARPVADGAELFEHDFPWVPVGRPGAPALEVYTSHAAFRREHPSPSPGLTVAFPFLIGVWPQGYAMAVNPGTDLAVEIPGDQVRLLLLWPDAPIGQSRNV
jgi:hypothetical protein